jgi:geranylgeranyl diphosphate synthase type II
LIADDLPMMDNDHLRRDKPSTHVQFGETTALLSSYGLIALAFEKIHDCAKKIIEVNPAYEPFAEKVSLMALKAASFAAGLNGATLGQFFDLHPKEACSVENLIYLKTVTLFEVTFLFGWLFSGGSLDKIDEVKELSYHFGFAYQIADDLDDYEEDLKKEKTRNFVIAYGIEEATNQFSFHLEKMKTKIEELKLTTADFKALVLFIEKYGMTRQKSLFTMQKATLKSI